MMKHNASEYKVSQPQPVAVDDVSEESVDGIPTKSTWEDKINMQRLGRKQQLIRRFKLLSTMAYLAMATAAWEIGIFLISQGLIDGGRPALIYSILWNFVGFIPIYLSMAEMASMAPISGAQFHWVSEFAPAKYQKILSYATGWCSTMAMQAGNAIGVFLTGTLIQVVILINNSSYTVPNWQATLLVIGVTALMYVANVFGTRLIPKLQVTVFILNVIAYLGFIIPIWLNARHATPKQVFTEFSNTGGWSSMPLAIFAGQLSGIYTQLGIDSAAHMAEEVKNAGKTIPITMMIVFVSNFLFVFVAVLTVCFAIPDLETALDPGNIYPAIYVMRQSMSDAWVTVVLAVIIALLFFSNISYLVAVTRDLFAFARDAGFPFHTWVSAVNPKRHIPQNAVGLSSIFSILLSLIYIGSPIAFYAITSLFAVALLQCYMVSIGCILWRRIREPETLPPTQFSLGRMGIPINIVAVVYCAWAFFWAFWPIGTPVTAKGFNWASVLYVSILIIAAFYYVFKARRVYKGGVVLVANRNLQKELS